MKAKKSLTSAAVALLMSDSLLPVGNVFANEQSTQESSISSAETKADLEKAMAVSGVENSATSSTQDTSSELSKELRNAKSTRLSDGRITVDISTPDQLQEAFNNAAIGQVNLVNDITLTKQINMHSSKKTNLVINGNNHTIDLQKFSFWGDDGDSGINVKLVNLTTLNGGGWGAFDSPSASVEVENVTHRGEIYLVANQIKLSGKADIQVVQQPGGGYNAAISSYWRMNNSKLTISSGADVTVNYVVTTGTPSSVLYVNQMSVEPNAKFTVTSPYKQPWGVIRVASNGGINVGENAQLNVNSSEANTLGIDFRDSASSLNVARGGNLSVSAAGNYAIGMYPGNSNLILSGAKFNIQSTKSNGLPLYMGAGGSISFDKQNIRAWLKGFATATDPQYSWDNVTGVVNMSGANTTSALSNNTEFNALFKNQNFSRISSDGRATQELTKTTINEVKDTDTIVSGKGEPNGKIELKVGDRFEIAGIASDGTIGPKTSATVLENNPEKYGVTAENYILGSNTINGTAKSGIARVKLFVNGHVVRQTAVENGQYGIWASDVVTNIGDKVEIIGMDVDGVERSRVTVTIMNAPVEEMTLTVNEYTFGENNITGTKSANVSRVQLFVNGVMKRTAALNGNNFEVYAKDVIVSASDKVEIVGFDKYGNEKRVLVTIKEKEPEKIDLTVNPYKLGDELITGTVSENVSYVTLNQGANVLKRGEVKSSNFSIWA